MVTNARTLKTTQYMFAPVDLNVRRPRQRFYIQNDTQSEDAFFCDTFHVPSAGLPLENSDDTILCSRGTGHHPAIQH